MAPERVDAKAAPPSGIDDGLEAQARAVQPILQRIRAIVREEAPQARETISLPRRRTK